MAVEMFSWPSLHERMCWMWGLNSEPLACQANTLPIELPRPNQMYACINKGAAHQETKKDVISDVFTKFLLMLSKIGHVFADFIWMDELGFYVPSTVFQSFRDDGRMNMKGSVQ